MDCGQTAQFSVGLCRNLGEVDAEGSGVGPADRCPAYEQRRLASRGNEEYDQFHIQPYLVRASHADADRSEILNDPARVEFPVGIAQGALHWLSGGNAFLEAGIAVRFHSHGTQITLRRIEGM